MGTVIEIDIVANLRSKTDGSGKYLKSPAWIYREIGGSVGEADSVREACGRILVVDAEIVESNFARDENAERSRSGLKFRPKKAMQGAEFRIYEFRGYPIGKGAGIAPLEVVCHFGLQLYVAVNVEGSPTSKTDEVPNWRGITESKVVRKGTDLNVIGMILGHHHWCGGGGKKQ